MDSKVEIIGFAGAKERAEDTARIGTSNAPPNFVKNEKVMEATATYVENKAIDSSGRYRSDRDVIEFNPDFVGFPETIEGRARFRWHEVTHRADYLYYACWEDNDFKTAIDKAKMLVRPVDGKNTNIFDKVLAETNAIEYEKPKYTKEDIRGVHDILSALREGKNDGLSFGHSAMYWAKSATLTPMEIFANIGTLDLMNGGGLSIIDRYFNDIFNAYRRIVK
ncbi:hypothetical protein R80B4_02026 [Fibrobacteres bacterium R8-0-B4]